MYRNERNFYFFEFLENREGLFQKFFNGFCKMNGVE